MELPAGTRLVLLRHAESEGNAGKIMQGGGEYPLSEHGRRQAAAAAAALAAWPLTLVVASDLSRAKDTAVLTAGRVDVVDARLRERGAGPWEGRPRAELESAHPGALEDDALRPDGFEFATAVVARMRDACSELVANPGLVVAVTHGAVLRLLAGDLGASAERFRHLEGLCLGPDLTVLGRIGPLDERTGS
jgi:probable phosphoglycerate mutase